MTGPILLFAVQGGVTGLIHLRSFHSRLRSSGTVRMMAVMSASAPGKAGPAYPILHEGF